MHAKAHTERSSKLHATCYVFANLNIISPVIDDEDAIMVDSLLGAVLKRKQ